MKIYLKRKGHKDIGRLLKMNNSDSFNHGLNGSSDMVFSNDPPPGAPFGWPGCSYPLPLPQTGSFGHATKWIWRTVPLILILLGTVGNILTALVIIRNFRKLSSTTVYLLTLAFTDTLFLYNEPLTHFVKSVNGLDLHSITDGGCKISVFLTFSSFHISAWVLVAVTVERVLSVIFPYKVKRRCTRRNAFVVTVLIVVVISVMDSHTLYGFRILSSNMYNGLSNCTPGYEEYFMFYKNQWFWIHFIVGFAIPFVSIAVGNTLVIHGLVKMRRRQKWMDKQVQNGHLSHGRHHTHHAKSLMIILVLLNTIFFISQTPLAIYLVYFPYFVEGLNKIACSDFQTYMIEKEKFRFWEAIVANFGYLNASLNFVLYVVSGSRFRREIVFLLTCKPKEIRIRSISSASDEVNRRHQQSKNVYHFN